MNPEQYDAWYETPRGRWIGDTEYRLLVELLGAHAGESLLDVGCGTGWFTRRFAREQGLRVTGLDPDAGSLAFARRHAQADETYVEARAEQLPFADGSFDHVTCITALCFVDDQEQALREMLRVARGRVVLGLLNRTSLLHRQVGRDGGRGGYRGAHWHTAGEIRELLDGLSSGEAELRSAVFVPSGNRVARMVEKVMPPRILAGGFLAVAVGRIAVSTRTGPGAAGMGQCRAGSPI